MTKKKAIVIGAGFAGLSAASYLAQKGFHVDVLEKHNQTGGRARTFEAEGFLFDMGPSWYWMPDVFERFFADFGHKVSDFYELKRLDPSYYVYWGKNDFSPIPAHFEALKHWFNQEDPGSGTRLEQFLKEAAYKYEVGINTLVYKPGLSLWEFMDMRLLYGLLKMDVLKSMAAHVRKVTKNERLLQVLEFPILFLGALPKNTPALYSLMNYADMKLGTWYPMGGMHKIAEGMTRVAQSQGVNIHLNAEVLSFVFEGKRICTVKTATGAFEADVVLNAADYHHTEQLLPKSFQSYSQSYWQKRTMAPSSLLFYVGLDKKLERLAHHNLFFDEPFYPHANEIYTHPQWPKAPLFYASLTSKTDPGVAPEGCENLFLLVPIAVDLNDPEEIREHYFQMIMQRLEKCTGQSILPHVVYKKSFAVSDFKEQYHSFRGNAYGLANTLNQTAILKPRCKSKKLSNLYHAGQLTVPGPGVPPSIISGRVLADLIEKQH